MASTQTPLLDAVDTAQSPPPTTGTRAKRSGRSLSIVQRSIVALAALPLVGIVAITTAGAAGWISTEMMVEISLALGEEPGMVVFAAMLWCSPIQWVVNRTQVPLRKMLGILFSGYAVSNFAMFVIERGLADSLSAPFLVAGTAAMLAAIPLLLTSGRWAQRRMGMQRWRSLHKLTYLVALALLLHVALIGEFMLSATIIAAALVARIKPIENALRRFGQRERLPS